MANREFAINVIADMAGSFLTVGADWLIALQFPRTILAIGSLVLATCPFLCGQENT